MNPSTLAAQPSPNFIPLVDGRAGIRTLMQVTTSVPSRSSDSAPATEAIRENSCNSCPAPNPSDSCLDFVSSDATVDRFDEIICPEGWQLDTYRRNPVFQNAHQYGDIIFTLGRALITEIRPAAPKSDGGGSASPGGTSSASTVADRQVLYQRIQFAIDANPIARIAYQLYKGKFLNAVSVGFIPLRWEDADGSTHPAREWGRSARTPQQAVPDDGLHPLSTNNAQPSTFSQQASTRFVRKYLEQELLEVSAVAIPANPNALALACKSGAIEKADIRETIALLVPMVGTPSTASPNSPPPQFEPLISFFRSLRDVLKQM